MRWTAIGGAFALALTWGAHANAQVDENLDHAARLTFQAGSEAFSAGDYATALDRFQQAYDLSQRPVLLYNIATCLDRLRRDEEAVAKFNAYLEAVPDAHDRVEVEARVAVLQQAIDERNAEQADRERREREAQEERERLAREAAERERRQQEQDASGGGLHAGITLGVAGAAVVVGALIVWSGLDAVSRNDEFEAYATSPGANFAEAEVLFDDVLAAEFRTNLLIGLTAGFAATAGVLAIFTDWSFGKGDADDEDDETADRSRSVAALPNVGAIRGGAMVGVTGSF